VGFCLSGLSWLLSGVLVAASVHWPAFGDAAFPKLILPVSFGPMIVLAFVEILRDRSG
jgi:hypothetical protein